MLTATLLLLAQASTATPAPSSEEVIVVGHRAEKALADCLARNCPPAEEIEATLQASVEQFTDGRYGDARRSLRRAIGRNKRYAATLPGPVSSLYATLSTVAEHDGDAEVWRGAARQNVDILRKHVGRSNVATLREELNLADTVARNGMHGAAGDMYRKVQASATAGGHRDFAAGAAFRRAWLALAAGDYRRASALADEAVTIAGPDNRVMGDLREIVAARIAILRGDADAVDRLAQRIRQPADGPPALISAKPVENVNSRQGMDGVLNFGRFDDSGVHFADVGYWIRPDGRTAEVELLRTSGLGQAKPAILRQVAERRYVPLKLEAGHPGIYRIDRFTVRATVGIPTGSHIRQRTGPLTVHIVDLTETEAMSTASRQRMAKATTTAPGAPVTP